MLRLYTPKVKSARAIFKQIKDCPGIRPDFHFDGEAEIEFPPELLHLVAKLAGAKKRKRGRKLSNTEKARLVEAGKANRFIGNSTGHQDENPAQI